MKRYEKIILFFLLTLSFFSFVRFSDNSNYWFVDIFSHFAVQYTFLALLLMAIFILKKKLLLAVPAGILFISNCGAILDFGESIQASEYTRSPIKVYSANVNLDNDELSELKRELQRIGPDILLLMEVTAEHFRQISPVIQTYPYHIERRSVGEKGTGFILLSKFPVLNYNVTILSEVCNFFLEATMDIHQKPVMFYGIHARRPDKVNFIDRKSQFKWLARQINKQSVPVIVAGDFNATPYSPVFKDFVKTTGLMDSREGFGWQPSWPAFFPLLWLPIDHILVSPDVQVNSRATGSYIGSDHYPVMAELSIAHDKNVGVEIQPTQ
jgi:endonuclease/exonuclease/phosphatase (EEP) superfamily protein YafD